MRAGLRIKQGAALKKHIENKLAAALLSPPVGVSLGVAAFSFTVFAAPINVVAL